MHGCAERDVTGRMRRKKDAGENGTALTGQSESGDKENAKDEEKDKENKEGEEGGEDEKDEEESKDVSREEEAVEKEDGITPGEGKYPKIEIETELECGDYWEEIIQGIEKQYSTDRKGEIIFYGASNFARWTTMESDMKEYKVQNHAFGGSKDVELVYYADRLLFPYEPKIVFFQTGSNDYVDLSGTDAEKVEKCMEYKKQMFAAFHEQMPDAKFVIMSGLLLPGRAEYLDLTLTVNEQLKQLADETDYLYFVDANEFTYDGTDFVEKLFVEDGIHLKNGGQILWYRNYIKLAIEQVITENGMDSVRR